MAQLLSRLDDDGTQSSDKTNKTDESKSTTTTKQSNSNSSTAADINCNQLLVTALQGTFERNILIGWQQLATKFTLLLYKII